MTDDRTPPEEIARMEREMLEQGGGAEEDFGPEVELPPEGIAVLDDED